MTAPLGAILILSSELTFYTSLHSRLFNASMLHGGLFVC